MLTAETSTTLTHFTTALSYSRGYQSSVKYHLHYNVLFQKPAYSLKLALGSSANLRNLKLKDAYSTLFKEQELSEGPESLTKLESFEFLKLDVTHMLASSIAALLRQNKGHLVKVGFKLN